MNGILKPDRLRTHISKMLMMDARGFTGEQAIPSKDTYQASVLFLLGMHQASSGQSLEPCLIFNKRSERVRQAGDLCFPGGGTTPNLDRLLAKILSLPGFPLHRWPHWQQQRRHSPRAAGHLSLMLATSLRESFEEMRLNPLWVTFLGPLPPQQLVMFHRVIYPMAGWIHRQKKFVLNWEVEKLVYIPLTSFFKTEYYGCYRLENASPGKTHLENAGFQEFPCFLYPNRQGTDLLWGATYRMVMDFLETVFNYRAPDPSNLPVVTGRLGSTYLTGSQLPKEGKT
ncbi:MAG: CoA pyrophosphatase [Deltaproteobacteria bacterium]|nr:CoA pyrophosphatase [Deltaproteobacteria bacterium]